MALLRGFMMHRRSHSHILQYFLHRTSATSRNTCHGSRRWLTSGSRQVVTPTILQPDNLHQMLSKYDTILMDCDGVLWGTDSYTKFPGIADSINEMRKMGKHLMFVSNNSLFSRSHFVKKFNELAEFDAPQSDVIAVNWAVAVYLKEILRIEGNCYVMGLSSMGEELDKFGIEHFGIGPDGDPVTRFPSEYLKHDHRSNVDAVVVAFDHHFNSNKLAKAGSYLLNPDCHYIVTNVAEVSLRIGENKDRLMPLPGAYIAAVTAAAKRQPVVIGKPATTLLDCIKSYHPNVDITRTVMIGDSITADIGFARNAGIDCCAVLTGVATTKTIEDLRKEESRLVPDYVISSLADIGKWLK